MYDLCIKLIVLGITSSIFELLFEPIAVNIFVWLIKTAVIKSFNQSQLELSMILICFSFYNFITPCRYFF